MVKKFYMITKKLKLHGWSEAMIHPYMVVSSLHKHAHTAM